MSRLEEIKNEVSKSKGFDSWKVVLVYGCTSQVVQISDEATLIYAKECSQASLEKLSYNTEIFADENYCFSYIDPKILESDDNIVLL